MLQKKFVLLSCIFITLLFGGTFQSSSAQPSSYWEQGLKAFKAKNYRSAIEAWLKDLEHGEATGRFKGKGASSKITLLRYIGGSYFELGLNGPALAFSQQALGLAEQLGNLPVQVDLHVDIGRSNEYLGRYEASLANFTKAHRLVEKIGGHPSEGFILNGLGQAHSKLGNYEQALDSFHRTLQFARSNGIHWLEGSAQLHIGMLYLDRGVFDKAIEYLHNANDVAHHLNDPRGQGATATSLGNFYSSLMQYHEALRYHQQSLTIKNRIQDKHGQGIAHLNIGNTYKNMGLRDQAIQAYETSLKICRDIHDPYGEALALNSLGSIQLAEQAYDSALPRFRQSLTIGEAIKSPKIRCLASMNIGASLQGMGKIAEAYQTMGQSLEICIQSDSPEELWKVRCGLGTIEAQMQQYDEAVASYKKAIYLIETMRQGVSESHDKISFMQDKMIVYDLLIELYRELHLKSPDKGYDKKALEIFERKQGRVFLEEMGRSGARHFAGLPDDVRRKEVSLPIKLANAKARLKAALQVPFKEQDGQLIELLQKEIASQQDDKHRLEAELRVNYADYYGLKYPQPVRVEQLQQQVLNPKEMIVVYGVMEKATCLWIIGKHHFSMHTVNIGEAALGEHIQTFLSGFETVRSAIENRSHESKIRRVARTSLEKIVPAGRGLYDLLLPPETGKMIAKANALYFVPTGPLYLLPFEALPTPGSASNQAAHYLIESHNVTYLSSASLLKTLREAKGRSNEPARFPLLAFAHPVYASRKTGTPKTAPTSIAELRSRVVMTKRGGSFIELPETEFEVRQIKQILDAPDASKPLYLREDAARSRVFDLQKENRLDDYRYIVFACHGYLPGLEDVDRLSQPALVLSLPDPQTGKDDYLTMADVFKLKFNADLVTLSACNTARGQSVRGEGVMGLTRAFMFAGTPSISVTLWAVESNSAISVNTGFFAQLKLGQGKAEALRNIKLKMINGDAEKPYYRHPFFWAPMVIFGDGE